MSNPQTPPHDLKAEVAVLGSVLLDNDVLLNREVGALVPQDFYREGHRKIWACIPALRSALTDDNQPGPVDLVTLAGELARRGQLDEVGGETYLIGLSEQTPTAAYAAHYARIVTELSHLRSLISHSAQVINHAMSRDMALEDIDQLAATPPQLPQAEQPVLRLGSVLSEVLDRAASGTGDKGISTGLVDLDKQIGGLRGGAVYVVAGRPSMGKSALGFQICATAAMNGHRALAFSLEMGEQDISTRLLCSEARVDLSRFAEATGGDTMRLGERDWDRLTKAQARLDSVPMDILVKRGLTLPTMVDEVRRAHAREPLGVFLLDYLGLVQVSGRMGENPVQRVSMISAALKSLAMELNIPVIALSQLSRAVEQRPNHRPILSDLRESGSVEQDADVVLMLYRDEYYNKDTDQQGIAEIIVGKQRNGPVGTVKTSFLNQFTRFADLAY